MERAASKRTGKHRRSRALPAACPAEISVPPPKYSVLSGPHAPTTIAQAQRSPAPAGRTWPPAMLVLFAGIRRYPGIRESRPRRSRRDNIGCCRSWGGARGRWGPASWSVAAAFDRQGKAIGCEPPARDERVCPPGGEPSRVYGYRSFCPLGGRDGFACGDPLHRWGQRFVHLASRRLCGLYGPMLCTLHFRT